MAALARAVRARLERHDVRDRARRLVFNHLLATRRTLNDVAALQRLAPLASPYLPWPDVAMRPSAMVAVLDEIATFGRSQIVECGGGLSTVYIGRLLRERGGTLTTVEHDSEWVASLRRQLAADGLTDTVDVVHAPLESSDDLATSPWYSTRRIGALGLTSIDMLIVDGPIATPRHPHIRQPALPYFYDRLAAGSLVVLDDALRRGEREIAARWSTEFEITMKIRALDGAIAVGRVRGARSTNPDTGVDGLIAALNRTTHSS